MSKGNTGAAAGGGALYGIGIPPAVGSGVEEG
jgi:hypothetical protein